MIATSGSSGGGNQPMRPSTKPRWVGKKTGPNPTDRAKAGTKRHHLTDAAGIPIAVALTAANRPDKEAIGVLLDARVVRAPGNVDQHLCLDKGYDYADAERAVRRRRYVPHIRRRGEERRACRRGTRARRWVVERTTSWFNRCRKLLIRWEKKPQNYLALVHFAAALLVWRGLTG
jgi:putative transposase